MRRSRAASPTRFRTPSCPLPTSAKSSLRMERGVLIEDLQDRERRELLAESVLNVELWSIALRAMLSVTPGVTWNLYSERYNKL